MKQPTVLIAPGRGNSETGHWQSILESSLPGTQRVEQHWNDTDIDTWARNIDRAVRALAQPPLIVAHSFGCLATAYAQIVLGTPVGATLFVAPADPQRFGIAPQRVDGRLSQPGLMIASANDPWLRLDQARAMASDWGVECVNLGLAGHVNVASGYGRWPAGESLVASMRAELERVQHDAWQMPVWQTRRQTECRAC
jgi:predicted alpha/beta hydrolase family esterase